MKKIKETYLLFLIVIGLISLSLYSTYALFTASTTINNVVGFETTLSTDSNIIEYEMVTVAPGENKIIEVKVKNNYGSILYYGVWYELLKPIGSQNVDVGLYTKQDNTPSSGQISTNTELTLLVGIGNYGQEEAMVNIGTIGSTTPNLNLTSTRKLIPLGWSDAILVTSDYLDAHSTTTPGNVLLDFSYTGGVQPTNLYPGTYKLEVWGAQGGYRSSTSYGGKGGYSYGTLTLTEDTEVFVYVGGSGNTGGKNGGFNGGGARSSYPGGGGASDIRLGTDSLYARVIVAGGGGSDGATSKNGMYGGGTSGGSTTQSYGSGGYGGGATGVSSSSWQTTTKPTSTTSQSGAYAGFGFGGNGISYANGYGGAGGGGWYGGSGSYPDSSGDDDRGGGGGSGYVYTSGTASQCPTGCLLTSKYYLTSAQTVAGNTSFTDFSGSTVTGHSGDGAARISGTGQIKAYTIPTITGLTDLNITKGTTANLNTGVSVKCEVGQTGCSLVETSITDTATLGEGTHKIYYIVKSTNNVRYRYARTITVVSAVPDKEFNFSKNAQTYTIQQSGTYTLEAWGAQGANNGSYSGGKGGYISGTISLNAGDVLTVMIGGQDGTNGGGTGEANGGGATTITLNGTTILTAAGGGGASDDGNGYSGGNGSGNGGGSGSTAGNWVILSDTCGRSWSYCAANYEHYTWDEVMASYYISIDGSCGAHVFWDDTSYIRCANYHDGFQFDGSWYLIDLGCCEEEYRSGDPGNGGKSSVGTGVTLVNKEAGVKEGNGYAVISYGI